LGFQEKGSEGTHLRMRDYKSISSEGLREIFQGIAFRTPPLRHQLVSILFALDGRDRCMFWHGIGTGKTLIALYTAQLWESRKILVICPSSVVRVWREQILEHTHFSSVELVGATGERRKRLDQDVTVYVVNYEGLKYLFGQKVCKRGRSRFIPDREAIESTWFDTLIVDEAHHVRSYTTIQSKIAYMLSRKAGRVLMLTGTPGDPMGLWCEYLVLDLGRSLGTSSKAFLDKYFFPINRENWSRGYPQEYTEWVLKKGSWERILERVANSTLRYSREECVDLPEATYEQRYVSLSKEQVGLIDKVVRGLQIELEGGQPLGEVVNHSSKICQITSGFIIAGRRVQRFRSNPKLTELLYCLKEIEGKCVVFHSFVEEGRIIEEACRKAGITFRSLRGEIGNKDEQYMEFREDPSIKLLIAHPQSGGEGIDLFEASTAIFFSNTNLGIVAREQCEGRIHRVGQTRKCLFIDLIAEAAEGEERSLDERIFEAIMEKKDTNSAILEWIENYGKVGVGA